MKWKILLLVVISALVFGAGLLVGTHRQHVKELKAAAERDIIEIKDGATRPVRIVVDTQSFFTTFFDANGVSRDVMVSQVRRSKQYEGFEGTVSTINAVAWVSSFVGRVTPANII